MSGLTGEVNSTQLMLYIGADIGGTFTDLVIFDSKTKELDVVKISSTPRNPEIAILNALEKYEDRADSVKIINHASTIATNALLTRVGLAKTALITNRGFRDILEIGRQRRPELYNLYTIRPTPLVRRADRFTIRGRMLPDGTELEPIDEDEVRRLLKKIARGDFQSIAICMLNSYANPKHEERVAKIAREVFRGHVSVSCEVNKEYREFERMSTTAVNASLAPTVSSYLDNLSWKLKNRRFEAPLYMMNSQGGMNTVRYASSFPISIIESGPAAGVLASKFLAKALALDRVLTFDMGGTTAKAGAIVDGEPDIAYEFEAAGKTHSGRSIKGSGYPVRHPFIDLAEVSAGGGTIAWADEGRAIRVGPESAGADPGPAAYGKGGNEPTVTDCNIALGKLNPNYLLGGKLRIFPDLSLKAIGERVGKRVGLNVYSTASGVIKIANNSMAKAISIVSLQRGRDPRDYTLVAFGGSGPIHACDLAEEMHIANIVVPPHPGLFSAYGLLTLDITRDFSFPVGDRGRDLDAIFKEARRFASGSLEEEGFTKFSFEEFVDLRYRGQSYELTLPYRKSADHRKEFDAKHKSIYGYASDEPLEIVNAKIRASVPINKVEIQKRKFVEAKARPSERRDVRFKVSFAKVPIYKREQQEEGAYESGPCIIEEYDATTVINEGWNWRLDGFGNILIERKP